MTLDSCLFILTISVDWDKKLKIRKNDPESASGSRSHSKFIGIDPSLAAIISEILIKIHQVEMDPDLDPESGSKSGLLQGILIQVLFFGIEICSFYWFIARLVQTCQILLMEPNVKMVRIRIQNRDTNLDHIYISMELSLALGRRTKWCWIYVFILITSEIMNKMVKM